MVLMDNTRALAVIERAERDNPFCDCGQPMAPVAHSCQVWLECTSRPERSGSGLRRVFGALDAMSHTRRLILDPS
jgi:hypothetical protein